MPEENFGDHMPCARRCVGASRGFWLSAHRIAEHNRPLLSCCPYQLFRVTGALKQPRAYPRASSSTEADRGRCWKRV